MGLKSGIHTAGAQHLTSLINSADGIKKFIPGWNIHETAREATEYWLSQQLGRPVNIDLLIKSVSDGQGFGKNGSLSLAQWCESEEESRVLESMNNEERFHMTNLYEGVFYKYKHRHMIKCRVVEYISRG